MKKNNKIVLFFPAINSDSKYHWFPFSLLAIGATLKANDFNPVIIDERITPNYEKLLKNHIKDALFFGTTAMTGYQIKGAINASQAVRNIHPDIKIIWGGRHASLLPEQTVKDPLVDIVVRGQGELTAVEIAKLLKKRKPVENVLGTTLKIKKRVISNPSRPICEVSKLHGFDWDLIDIKNYINPETKALAYFSSFGCPARCGFCANSWSDRRWSSMQTDFILDDLQYLIARYHFKNIIFQDSNYFVNKTRAKNLAQGFLDRDFNVKWKASIRADQLWRFDDDVLELFERSGLFSLFIGIESGSQRMLDQMNKDTNPEDAIKSITKASKFNFEIHASLMFALPNETIEDLKQTIEHVNELRKINPNIKIQTCFYSPYPCTPLNELAEKCGFVPPDNLRAWQNTKEQTEFIIPPWFEKNMSEEYKKIFFKAFHCSAATKFGKLDK